MICAFYLLACLLTNYLLREQISYFCKNGTKGMWLAKTADGKVQQITPEWVTQGIQVFQGDFTCCNRMHEGMACCEKEKLVTPILGLLGAAYELRTVHPEIYSLLDQPNMFPEMFTLEKKTESGKVVKQVKPLFGDRVGCMKDYIDHDPAGAAHRQLVTANAKKVSSDRKARQSRRFAKVHELTGELGTAVTLERSKSGSKSRFADWLQEIGLRWGLHLRTWTSGVRNLAGDSRKRFTRSMIVMKPMGLANFGDFGHRSSRSSDVAPNEAQRRLSLANFRGLGRRSSKSPDAAQRRSFSTGSRDSDASTI